MSGINKDYFRHDTDLVIDTKLGVVADKDSLNNEQHFLYISRHETKNQNWAREDLLPFQRFKFGKVWGITEFYINSRKLMNSREMTRLGFFYSQYFVHANIEPFLEPLAHTSRPFMQPMIFNYYRTREDSTNLVNYMMRTLRKLAQYGLADQPQSLGTPPPTQLLKKSIKENFLANAQKNVDALLEEREKNKARAKMTT